MSRYLIIIPTYNEIENIPEIIPRIFELCPEVNILVVDDSSPDGTAAYIKEHFLGSEKVFLLQRKKKDGLGRAYLAGMQWALDHKYDFVVQMDADFSHSPSDLRRLLDQSSNYDLIIGSRWVKNGAVKNWGWGRKFISRGGSLYASTIINYPIKDWTGGFNLWRTNCLKLIDFSEVKSNGYSFQIEMKAKAAKQSFKIKEHPIVFVDRRVGESKMSKKIIFEAFFKVWSFR